jgi:hypothetical protein
LFICTVSTHRYYTRAVIIPFSDPPLGQDLSAEELQVFATLNDVFAEASRAVGYIIHLGHLLKESGFVEIRTNVYPFVKGALGGLSSQSNYGLCHNAMVHLPGNYYTITCTHYYSG